MKPGIICTISGWGVTESTGDPEVLMATYVPIANKTLCSEAYKKKGGVSETEFCAGYYGKKEKDACIGDSGGPLIIDGKQAGIISRGYDFCDDDRYPGVYVDVSMYYDWIIENAHLETNYLSNH